MANEEVSIMSPLVSIIIPVFNGSKYVSEAIKSAMSQTYHNIEILIVNDGSIDNSKIIISEYLSSPKVRYYEQNNQGVAAARNTALKNAKGKYIGFLDQDDVWAKNKLESQVAILELDSSIAFVHARQGFINSEGSRINFDWQTGASGFCFKELFTLNKIAILTVLIRKDVIDDVGAFNEQLSGTDDYDMWLRVTLKYPIKYMNIELAKYRFHDSNASKNSFKMTILDLKTINTILSNYPHSHAIAGNRVIKSRLFELNYQLGEWYSWKTNNFDLARKHYFHAIIKKPYYLNLYMKFIYCTMNKSQRKSFDWYASLIRKAFVKLL